MWKFMRRFMQGCMREVNAAQHFLQQWFYHNGFYRNGNERKMNANERIYREGYCRHASVIVIGVFFENGHSLVAYVEVYARI